MPFRNEHSARLQDPGKFDSFGRTQGGNLFGGRLKVPSTIDVIWGHPKGGPKEAAIPQALRFPTSRWTEDKARKWLKDHNVKYIAFEPAAKRTEGMSTAMKFQARVLAMAEEEILGMVSPRAIRDIKREDPSPKLMAFVVGQEGEARGAKVSGIGATVQRWFRSAIEALVDRLPLGIAAYHDHAEKNTASRESIGEIVGKALRHLEGILSAIAVTYIYPAFKGIKLDIASIEANIFVPHGTREFDVTDVDIKKVTGIALGDSANHSPAFPGATLLAELQAFAEKNPEKGDQNMTLEEIKEAIQEGKFKPSDVFSPKDLTSDPFIVEHVEEKTNNLKGYQIRKLQETETKVEALEKDKKDLTTKLQAHERTLIKSRAKETFDKLLTERPKLKEDARLLKFIGKAFDKDFQPTEEAKLKDELNKFVDDQVKEYNDLFGEPKPGDTGKAGETGTPAGDSGDDLLNPKNNDLIPQ